MENNIKNIDLIKLILHSKLKIPSDRSEIFYEQVKMHDAENLEKLYPNLKTFCVAPFIHLSTKTDGSIKTCCRALPGSGFSNIKNESLRESWNNKKIKKIRLDLLNGIRNKNCQPCWHDEDKNVYSLREKINTVPSRQESAIAAIKTMHDDGHIETNPTWLELKTSNVCNLKCRMCHPMDSTSWSQDFDKIKHIHEDQWQNHIQKLYFKKDGQIDVYDENFYNDLKNAIPNLKEVHFAGGEVLYDENHYRILDMLLPYAKNIHLGYATNMTILKFKNYNVVDYWKNFKKVELACSIDGPKKLSEYIRSGSNADNVEENIKILLDYKNIKIIGKLTVSALNIFYIPEALEWFNDMNVHRTDLHFVTFPKFLDCSIWKDKPRLLITNKLFDYKEKVSNQKSYERKRIPLTVGAAYNFFTSKETYDKDLWNKFIEYNKILDQSRNQSYKDFDFLREYMT